MFERIPFDYEKSELTGYSNYSYWHSTFRTFFKQRSSTVLLLAIMCAFVAMSLLYPAHQRADPRLGNELPQPELCPDRQRHVEPLPLQGASGSARTTSAAICGRAPGTARAPRCCWAL